MMWVWRRDWVKLLYHIEQTDIDVNLLRQELSASMLLQREVLLSISRGQRRIREDMATEKELTEQLLANLDSASTELEALSQVVDNLVTTIGNQSDVSPDVQAALDKVTQIKERIIATALKGTPSEPQVPEGNDQ